MVKQCKGYKKGIALFIAGMLGIQGMSMAVWAAPGSESVIEEVQNDSVIQDTGGILDRENGSQLERIGETVQKLN